MVVVILARMVGPVPQFSSVVQCTIVIIIWVLLCAALRVCSFVDVETLVARKDNVCRKFPWWIATDFQHCRNNASYFLVSLSGSNYVYSLLESKEIARERENLWLRCLLLWYGKHYNCVTAKNTQKDSSEKESCSVPEIKIAFLASMLGDLRHTWMSKRDQHLTCEIFDVPIVVFQRNSTAQIMAR